MARQCNVCGKSAQIGNQVTTRGKKKYLGGVGTKVTGISRRHVQAESAAGEDFDRQRQPQGGPGLRAMPPQRRRHQGRPGGAVQSAPRARQGEVKIADPSWVGPIRRSSRTRPGWPGYIAEHEHLPPGHRKGRAARPACGLPKPSWPR